MRTIKSQPSEQVRVVIRPRLVKANEVAAREAAQAEREREVKERPVPVRTPRSAGEARDMFKSLFNEAA